MEEHKNFLHYFNTTNLNIIPKPDFMDLTQQTFHLISENLSRSLGPLGSSATILDGMLTEATKDGYTILSKYTFNNRYKKMIYNLIKAPCTRMNNTVGDGTTTAITLTDAILDNYIAEKDAVDNLYRLPRDFTTAWDAVVNDLIDRVNKMSTPVDPEDYDTIYSIAHVVSNGNDEVSAAIAQAYHDSKSPAIKMKDSPTNKSYLEIVDGFEFPANAIDTAFVKNQDLSVTEKNAATIIFDYKIDTDTFEKVIIPLEQVYRNKGQKLIVIAAQYDDMMLDTTVRGYVNLDMQRYGSLGLSLLQFAQGKLSKHQLGDLAVVLNSIVVNQQITSAIKEELDPKNPDSFVENLDDPTGSFYRIIGYTSEALITCENGSIFQPAENITENKYYQETVAVAQSELDDIIARTDYEKQSFASKIYDARSRLLQLNMKNYIYYIGADSDLQKQIIHDSVDDVIKCLRSAVKYGVVPGCQISIIKAVDDYIKDESKETAKFTALRLKIAEIIRQSCIDVYSKVLNGPEHDGISKAFNIDNNDTDSIVDKTCQLIYESVDTGEVFDISTLEFNKNIITSVETDTMVLSAASELIKVLISGNQCIFIDSDVTESHQDTMDAYV